MNAQTSWEFSDIQWIHRHPINSHDFVVSPWWIMIPNMGLQIQMQKLMRQYAAPRLPHPQRANIYIDMLPKSVLPTWDHLIPTSASQGLDMMRRTWFLEGHRGKHSHWQTFKRHITIWPPMLTLTVTIWRICPLSGNYISRKFWTDSGVVEIQRKSIRRF